jgi:hypothetical protein
MSDQAGVQQTGSRHRHRRQRHQGRSGRPGHGELTTDRLKIATPEKSTPKNVAAVVGEIVANFADAIGDGRSA